MGEYDNIEGIKSKILDAQNNNVKDVDKICLEAVTEAGWALRLVKNKTRDICLAAVRQNAMALASVEEQTPEICLAAAMQDGGVALQFVKEQTHEICLAAVKSDKSNGLCTAIRLVKEQTPEICLASVKHDPNSLEYIKEQTPEICMEAVKRDGEALVYVREETPEICIEALKESLWAIDFVSSWSPELYYAIIENHPTSKMSKFLKECFRSYVSDKNEELNITSIDGEFVSIKEDDVHSVLKEHNVTKNEMQRYLLSIGL